MSYTIVYNLYEDPSYEYEAEFNTEQEVDNFLVDKAGLIESFYVVDNTTNVVL